MKKFVKVGFNGEGEAVVYGNRPREYNKYYFVKTEKPGDEKGYCLRLKGCL